jgi:GntR family transcriptional regulator, histidine utilization repressor
MSPITWQSVKDEALRRIRNRDWPPGGQIPHEADLAAELGCSRVTVNRALRELAEAGLLERRRKAGTRVPLNPVRKATFEIPIIRHDIEGRGLTPGYRLISQQMHPAPGTLAQRLHLAPDTAMLQVLALHLANDAPFCMEDRWINPASVPDLAAVDFTTISANEWLVQNAPFSGGEIGFSATPATVHDAAHLGCAPNDALFMVERITWAGTVPITSVRLTYAPGYQMLTLI